MILRHALDMHNSITAAQLLELVGVDGEHSMMWSDVTLTTRTDDTTLPNGYASLLRHTSLFTFTDILLFLHKLPSYLQSNHKVAPYFTFSYLSLDFDKPQDRSSRVELLFTGISFALAQYNPRKSDRAP